jgi:hypothetical protein
MDKPEKLATQVIQDEEKQNKNTKCFCDSLTISLHVISKDMIFMFRFPHINRDKNISLL